MEAAVDTHAIVNCSFERHADAMLDIFNDAIQNSTALFDYKPRTRQNIASWFDVRRTGGFPVVGIEDHDGTLLAFGSYSTFRAWPAYKYTVEHSVYVRKDSRGQGLGRIIMQELISAARHNDLHAMIGVIEANNTPSIALHEQLGFKRVGLLPQVGYKFGRWLDVALYQLLLNTPAHPNENDSPGLPTS